MHVKPYSLMVVIQFFVFLFQLSFATDISTCTNLTTMRGTYAITADITNWAGLTCFNITAENVTLNGQGHTITGTNASNTVGVYTNKFNTTVANLNVSLFNIGIYFHGAKNGTIENNTVYVDRNTTTSPTFGAGIIAYNSADFITLKNNSAYSTYGYGISISQSANATATNCSGSTSFNRGISLNIMVNSVLANITGSGDSGYGIILAVGSNYSRISNAAAYSASNYAFYLSVATGNNISNSIGQSTSSPGFTIGGASQNNTVTNMTGSSSGGNGIYIITGIYQTIINSTAISNTLHGFLLQSASNTIIGTVGISNGSYGILLRANMSILNSTGISITNPGIGMVSIANVSLINSTGISNASFGIYVFQSQNITINGSIGISNASYGTYIRDSSNVSFDCQGRQISSQENNATYGFYVLSNDTKIKNCNLYGSYGFFLNESEVGTNLSNNTLHSNQNISNSTYLYPQIAYLNRSATLAAGVVGNTTLVAGCNLFDFNVSLSQPLNATISFKRSDWDFWANVTANYSQYENTIYAVGDSITRNNLYQPVLDMLMETNSSNHTYAEGGIRCNQVYDYYANNVPDGNGTTAVVLCGVNDAGLGVNASEIGNRIESIYNLSVSKNNSLVLMAPSTGLNDSTCSIVLELNRWLFNFTAAHGIPLVDFYRVMSNGTACGTNSTRTNDGVHPNALGSRYVANAVWREGFGARAQFNANVTLTPSDIYKTYEIKCYSDNPSANILAASAEIPADAMCGNYNVSGQTYLLGHSLGMNGGTCINITAENVTIDCQGFSITGNDSTGAYGIYSNSSNTAIRNCTISRFGAGIYLDGAINGTIRNNTVSSSQVCINLTSPSANNSVFYNYFYNCTTYVSNGNTNNTFNITNGTTAFGNYYDNITNMSIFDLGGDNYGERGADYPLSSQVINGKWAGPGSDWGPIGAPVPYITLAQVSPVGNGGNRGGNATFSFNATSLMNVTNCSLYINGTLNRTNSSPVYRNVIYNFSMQNMTMGSYNWSVNCTEFFNLTDASQARALKVFPMSKPLINMTDLNQVNISNITNFTVENATFARIRFTSQVDLSNTANLDSYISLLHNRAELDSGVLGELNTSAEITFYSIFLLSPKIMRDGYDCPEGTCRITSFADNALSFTVTGFSAYSAEEGMPRPDAGKACSRSIEIEPIPLASFVSGQGGEIQITVRNAGTCAINDAILGFIAPGWQYGKKAAGEIPAGASKAVSLSLAPPGNYEGKATLLAVAEAAGVYQTREFEAEVLGGESGAKGQETKPEGKTQEAGATPSAQAPANATSPKIRVKVFDDLSGAIRNITKPISGATPETGEKNALQHATPALLLGAGIITIAAALAIAALLYLMGKRRKVKKGLS